MEPEKVDPLAGVSEQERQIMSRLLRMPPERQKAATKPTSIKGEAQEAAAGARAPAAYYWVVSPI